MLRETCLIWNHADIDECSGGNHTCDRDRATCTNTIGSYKCACKDGYDGDGEACIAPGKLSGDYCLTAGKNRSMPKKLHFYSMDTFASKWTCARRKLARFPVSDPWVLNFVSICYAVISSLSYVFMPQEVYSDLRFLFLPPPLRGQKSTSAALHCRRGNYFRPYLSITRVCHRGAA